VAPAPRPGTRLTSPPHPRDQEGKPRVRGTPPTRRDSRAASHGTTLKTPNQPRAQATEPRSRKIEASDATFWMPKPEDIGDDGIGAFFHDT